jgi:hypothetical protein
MLTMSGEEWAAARAIDLRWRGRPVDLLAVDEAAGMALVIELGSGFALTVAVRDLTWRPVSRRISL